MLRVVAGDAKAAWRFIKGLKDKLKKTFKQEEIFIVTRKVRRV